MLLDDQFACMLNYYPKKCAGTRNARYFMNAHILYYQYYFIFEQKEDYQKIFIGMKQDVQRDFPELSPEYYNFLVIALDEEEKTDYI